MLGGSGMDASLLQLERELRLLRAELMKLDDDYAKEREQVLLAIRQVELRLSKKAKAA